MRKVILLSIDALTFALPDCIFDEVFCPRPSGSNDTVNIVGTSTGRVHVSVNTKKANSYSRQKMRKRRLLRAIEVFSGNDTRALRVN